MTKLKKSANGFTYLSVKNEKANAKISLQGAHLFHFSHDEKQPFVWLSKSSLFEQNKAIRGGVPVCWPWFGKHQTQSNLPQHGFARTSLWSLEKIDEPDKGTTIVTLTLNDSPQSMLLWPYAFSLSLTITIGDKLVLSLRTFNKDKKAFEITEALHTYLWVEDIGNVEVSGLENVKYVDSLDDSKIKSSFVPLSIHKEVDRVYFDTKDCCVIHDKKRKLIVEKFGSNSTVVWNPWSEKAKAMQDFDNEGYKTMLCIETANALKNSIIIEPGESHTITQTIYSL
ncbi:D-hexose-6-phosphate mutarotase [bacterium]|nr:D-hexose-6-phosphate mutarotase [bacterium]MBU1995404.1 D-hexose-6-phosphate mutarotase [bacterium]